MKAKITEVFTETLHGVKENVGIKLQTKEGLEYQFKFTMDELHTAWLEMIYYFDIRHDYELNSGECKGLLSVIFQDGALGKSVTKLREEIQATYEIDNGQALVTIIDGDNKQLHQGKGYSVAKAMIDAAVNAGFETKITQGKTTIREWLKSFAYGREKRSNEILQAEMDEIFAPEKGAW